MKKTINILFLLILIFFWCSKNINYPDETLDQSDISLMKKAQEDVFKYFWNYAHPNSKLTRERIHENNISFDENTITTGGSGFGFLNILMGIENQFITKAEGISHLETALNFLENADRFHDAWPH